METAATAAAAVAAAALLQAQAMGCWQEANERRTGRHPSTPQIEASVRAGHMAHASSQMESGAWIMDHAYTCTRTRACACHHPPC